MNIDELSEIVLQFQKKHNCKHTQFLHASTTETAIIQFEGDFYLLIEDILTDLNLNIEPLIIFEYITFCESDQPNITYHQWLVENQIIN